MPLTDANQRDRPPPAPAVIITSAVARAMSSCWRRFRVCWASPWVVVDLEAYAAAPDDVDDHVEPAQRVPRATVTMLLPLRPSW